MIAFLQGTILETENDHLILNVKGVGYELSCSQNTLGQLEGKDLVQLWVYTHVKEDALQLFGFSSKTEKQLFLSLIKVNGIGAKMAITILSACNAETLSQMIDDGDVKGLTKLPKIGKKTAEQMILSLKGKLVILETEDQRVQIKSRSEICSALVNLGFRMGDVERAVDKMEPNITIQQGVREGLSALTQP